ncbi:hypothetical protein HMPREF9541_00124 [Escherichia coli MS 116-1]|nr:hypothetical protein HMPREF9553_03644 [Escherichia coli MS 200-1]EFK17474.1 hypothetical protein HMPREF9541_00124 [Escherichia coli MS 116-1]
MSWPLSKYQYGFGEPLTTEASLRQVDFCRQNGAYLSDKRVNVVIQYLW